MSFPDWFSRVPAAVLAVFLIYLVWELATGLAGRRGAAWRTEGGGPYLALTAGVIVAAVALWLAPWRVPFGSGIAILVLVGYFILESGHTVRRRGWAPPKEASHDRGSFAAGVTLLVCGLLLAVLARVFLPILAAPGPRGAWEVAGTCLIVAGFALRGVAVWTLGQAYSPVVAIQPGQVVVESGPYRFVRHPAYSGLFLVFIGIGVSLDNLGSLVACVVLPVWAMLMRVRVEEQMLEREFGEPYRRYAQGKKRIVPGVW